MLKKSLHRYAITLLAFLLILLMCPNFTQAQQLPRSVTLGSPAAGSLLYSLGSGLAKGMKATKMTEKKAKGEKSKTGKKQGENEKLLVLC